MFFQMLKKDLTKKKGLNLILFLFITAAAALVFIGVILIDVSITGARYTEELCHSTDFQFLADFPAEEYTQKLADTTKLFQEYEMVSDVSVTQLLHCENNTIDFANFDETKMPSFMEYRYYLSTVPTQTDLVFDTSDKPFSVEKGCIALPVAMRALTGAAIGDSLRVTTPDGTVHTFTISVFFKESLVEFRSYQRFLLSETDYQQLVDQFSVRTNSFALNLKDDVTNEQFEGEGIRALIQGTRNYGKWVSCEGREMNIMSDNEILKLAITAFVVLISVFIILIVLMTIRFTMVAALKEEEREIGMMKALGVDSLGFRWLFAAKYITFAVVGGAIGIVAGLPLSRIVLGLFASNCIAPNTLSTILIGGAAVLFIVACIVLFSLLVMRRINRISVVDAIHGENQGERFQRRFAFFLHKRKWMPVSLGVALLDILTRLKRYLFLIIAYTLGAAILLLIVNLKNSVISDDFMRYFDIYHVDFYFNFDQKTIDKYTETISGDMGFFDALQADIDKHNIPAEIVGASITSGKMKIGQGTVDYGMMFDTDQLSHLRFCPGSSVPQLANEIALSRFTAEQHGLQIGDLVTFELREENENKEPVTVERQFVITGFVDYMESGSPMAYLSHAYKGAVTTNITILAFIIHADGAEKETAFQQLETLFGADIVLNKDEFMQTMMFEYDRLFTLLELVMGATVLFVTVLITYLYASVFLSEEVSEIALMKSLGIRDRTIKAQQILRFVLLLAVSLPLSILLLKTGMQAFANQLFALLELTGFKFLPEYLYTLCIVPLLMLAAIGVTVFLKLGSVKRIAIWEVTKE